MRAFIIICAGVAFCLTGDVAVAQQLTSQIQAYVTPYYDSNGPAIAVGDFSEALLNADREDILEVTDSMRKKWRLLPTEAMYVAAIRLYDLGKKDEAVFWFYSAQWRSRLYRNTLVKEAIGGLGSPDFERLQANTAFQRLAGQNINGYAFGDVPKLLNTLKNVQTENAQAPELAKIYPDAKFIEPTFWQMQNRQVQTEFSELREQIEKNIDQIKSRRKANGLDGQF